MDRSYHKLHHHLTPSQLTSFHMRCDWLQPQWTELCSAKRPN